MATHNKWRDENYLAAYKFAKDGSTDAQIAELMGVTPIAFMAWKKKKPALEQALEEARAGKDGTGDGSFRDHVYATLPDELRNLWERINLCETAKSGRQRLESLFGPYGKDAKQHMFLYALVHCNFNHTEACRKVGIDRKVLDHWVTNEPGFGEIIDHMHVAKKDFYEGALVGKVAQGDVPCILFANRTVNRDRGYGEKMEMEHTGSGLRQPKSDPVNLLELGLSDEVLDAITEALIRRVKGEKAEPRQSALLEVKSEPVITEAKTE